VKNVSEETNGTAKQFCGLLPQDCEFDALRIGQL
jgi:hypothetical protein